MLPELPLAPPSFLNLSDSSTPGFYLVGSHVFTPAHSPLTCILRRSLLGTAEDFLLILFALFAILVLHAIVYIVLLQHRFQACSPAGVRNAVFLREIFLLRPHAAVTAWRAVRPKTIRVSLAAAITCALLLALIGADVALLFLAMPVVVQSGKNEYNLKGVQPVGTTKAHADLVQTTIAELSCVSPVILPGKQKRNFVLTGCIHYGSVKALYAEEDVSDKVVVGSWYHEGGSDHLVEFGAAQLSVGIRARVAMNVNSAPAWRLLFESRDTEDFAQAKYLQDAMIQEAIKWTCRQGFAQDSCDNVWKDVNSRSEKVVKEVTLWRRRDGILVNSTVPGIVTTYDVALNAPFLGLREGLRVFASSAAIQEVRGVGMYESLGDDAKDSGLKGLISESVRVFGIGLFCVLLCFFLLLLVTLSGLLTPRSLAEVAGENLGKTQAAFQAGEDRGAARIEQDVNDQQRIVGAETGYREDDDSYGTALRTTP